MAPVPLFAALGVTAVVTGCALVIEVLMSASREQFLLIILNNCLLSGVLVWTLRRAAHASPPLHEEPILHWDPGIMRRGIGDLLKQVNHIAIIVTDVGRSCAFYTEIMGFQQIQRPNFDRHGAWLTMGNTELHLIKGMPNPPSGEDLIVSHIALDTDDPEAVLKKLIELEVPFRQNISVPDPKKARDNLVECFENSEGKILQFFIRDPDGYYWELCNCDILTKFCLFRESSLDKPAEKRKYVQLMDAVLGTYRESGQAAPHVLRCPLLFKIGIIICRRLRKVRADLQRDYATRLEVALETVTRATEVDEQILQNFEKRQKTYCDALQGFSKMELHDALVHGGNQAAVAVLILGSKRTETKICLPPQYLLSEGGRIDQQVFNIKRSTSLKASAFGTKSMYAPKPFFDNLKASGASVSLGSLMKRTPRASGSSLSLGDGTPKKGASTRSLGESTLNARTSRTLGAILDDGLSDEKLGTYFDTLHRVSSYQSSGSGRTKATDDFEVDGEDACKTDTAVDFFI